MAFVPQPTLPRTSHRSSQIRVSIRAAADGIISVSRRRRVYEFLSASSGTAPSTGTDSTAAPGTTRETASKSANGVAPAESPDPEKVRHDLITRMQQREAAIKADAAEKEALWEAELASLRQPQVEAPEVVPPAEEAVVEPQPVVSYYPSRSSQTASVFGANDVAPAGAAPRAPLPIWEVTETPSSPAPSVREAGAVTEPAPEIVVEVPSAGAPSVSSVSELYAPPRTAAEDEELSPIEKLQEFVEDAREAVEDVVEEVRDAVETVVEDVIEAFTPEQEKLTETKEEPVPKESVSEVEQEPEPEPKPMAEAEPEPASIAEEKEDRSIGEVILDAIVEGVPTPESEKEPQKPAVDKSDLISLIDSGKVKNLTVTKLRRLLSQNGLKTSGRKAELIARLTSFAKAK